MGGGEEEGGGLLTIQLALKAHYPHLQYFHIANPRLITVNSKTKLARPLGRQPKRVFSTFFQNISSMILGWGGGGGLLSFLIYSLYL